MIPVTKSFLPPIDEYTAQIQRVYNNQWLTNRGELVKELEAKLTGYLNLKEANLLITTNGTLPIQIALKLLAKGGEVITTPFSYVATTSAIVWENCTPVFVDIHPHYLTIDETKIEAAITEKTTCILATHVFGNPCAINDIEHIAQKHNLKVIYDAAHCFGVKYQGKSIFEYGDISTCSFHATKLFHTGEGGGIFSKDKDIQHQIYYSHNFGHDGPVDFHGLGINAKISELQAAMGLAVLPYMSYIIEERRKVFSSYNEFLSNTSVIQLKLREGVDWNMSYFPVVFQNEDQLLKAQAKLKEISVIPRRYFYPALSQLPYVKEQGMPVAEFISERVLCLPLYVGLTKAEIKSIAEIINTL